MATNCRKQILEIALSSKMVHKYFSYARKDSTTALIKVHKPKVTKLYFVINGRLSFQFENILVKCGNGKKRDFYSE